MTLHLSPDVLEGAYIYLMRTAPFNSRGWRKIMPHPESIAFNVSADRISGYFTYEFKTGQMHVGVSCKRISTTDGLLGVMAHEMIHVYQRVTRTETKGTEHNAEFDRIARRVARIHGWGFMEFRR